MNVALKDFDTDGMVELIRQKQQASDKTMEINRILKSSMADDEAARFAENENALLRKKEETSQKIYTVPDRKTEYGTEQDGPAER